MLKRFLNQLLGNEPLGEPLPGETAERALAVLLVRVARADRDYDQQERGRIITILERRNGLSRAEAEAMLAEAEEAEAELTDTVHFTRDIKQGIPLEERIDLMQELWSLALTDTQRDPGEDQLLRLTAGLLGVSDQDSARARLRAAGDLGVG